MHLIALQEFEYDGKRRKIGDEFEAPHLHGMLFIEHGRAKSADKSKLQTTALKAEEPDKDIADKDIRPDKRGRYPRRDMRAEK